MKKIQILCIVVVMCLFVGAPFVLGAEIKFPARPVEMVVPFPPGGTADIAARIVMHQLSKELKIALTVVNKPGASGTIGAAGVAKGKPDGHMLLTGNAACLIIPSFFMKNVVFETERDFLPLAYVGESPSVLAVQSTSPFKTFDELVSFAKKNPGKLSYATSGGLSSVSTMNMEVVKNQAGLDIATIVYEGGGPSLAAILGGHVDIIASSIPALGAQVDAGKLRVLVTTKKLEEMPSIPTLKDKGYPMVVNWTGFFVSAKVPKEVHTRLVAAFDKALQNPEVIKKLKDAGYVPERKTPQEMSQFLKEQHNVVARIVKDTKIKK